MKIKRISITLIIAVLSVLKLSSQQITLSQIKQLPEKMVSFYGTTFSSNISEKIRNAPNNVIRYLCKMDETKKYTNHTLSKEEKDLFLEYYSFLPEAFQKVISEKVYSIYLIDGLPYGGMADYAFDDNGIMFCVLFINAKVLQISLSDWLTERDNSPFKSVNRNNQILVNCNSEYKGLLHTLVHESCHIYDYYNHITPYTEPSLKETGVMRTEFVNYWIDYFEPIDQYKNVLLQQVSFWGFGKKLDIKNAERIIDYLQNCPFSSMYGAKNWADDFAETYTFYYLKKNFNIEYEVMYKWKGNIIKKYVPTNNELVEKRYPLFVEGN